MSSVGIPAGTPGSTRNGHCLRAQTADRPRPKAGSGSEQIESGDEANREGAYGARLAGSGASQADRSASGGTGPLPTWVSGLSTGENPEGKRGCAGVATVRAVPRFRTRKLGRMI